MTELTDGQIARKALDILGSEGQYWTKHQTRWRSTFRGDVVCIAAALFQAATGRRSDNIDICTGGLRPTLHAKLARAMHEHDPAHWYWDEGVDTARLVGFNDYQGTTFDDIRVILEKVAAEG